MNTTTITLGTYATHDALAALENGVRKAGKVALFVAAPFIGLAYVAGMPFFGLGLLAWMGAKAAYARRAAIGRFLKRIGLFAAGPFIGLAYAAALPFVGLGMLGWVAVTAARERRTA